MTPTTFNRPVLRHRFRNHIRQLFNGWPWIVWLAAVLAVILLLPGGMYRIRFYGVTERTYEFISPLENGRLRSLYVNLGESVEAGQLIGELDSASLATELLMDQVSLMKTRDKTQGIYVDIEKLRLEEAKTKATLHALEAKWERTQELISKNLLLEQETENLEPEILALKEVVQHYPILIATMNNRLEIAEKGAEKFNESDLKQLQESQRRLVASTAGVVAEVLHQPGDVVETGDPVIRISNISTHRIIAFMPENKRTNISEGDRCKIITTANREIYFGTVKTITADIRKLPVYTGFNDQIMRGRRIVIELDDDIKLVPGEQVVVVPDISILDQWLGKK